MATAVQDFKVKDINLAGFGRKEIDIAESELLQMYPKSKQGRFIIEYDLDGKARTTTTEEEPFELLRWQV